MSSSNYEVRAIHYSFLMNDVKHFYTPAIQFEKHIELSQDIALARTHTGTLSGHKMSLCQANVCRLFHACLTALGMSADVRHRCHRRQCAAARGVATAMPLQTLRDKYYALHIIQFHMKLYNVIDFQFFVLIRHLYQLLSTKNQNLIFSIYIFLHRFIWSIIPQFDEIF